MMSPMTIMRMAIGIKILLFFTVTYYHNFASLCYLCLFFSSVQDVWWLDKNSINSY